MNKDLLQPFFLANKVFTVCEFATYHQLNEKKAAMILASLTAQKKLLRIQRGMYLPISNRGLTPEETFSDPWIIVPYVFPNSIISGWSSAHFWGLTEQLFQTTIILQTKDVFKSLKHLGRHDFMLFKTHLHFDFGVESTWRENIEVNIANSHRTIIDMLENPKCGGGIQHTIDCFKVYLSDHFNETIFLQYASHVTNGVFFKRLGYIAEILLGDQSPLVDLAKNKMTQGPSLIDSSLTCKTFITRWGLYISSEIDL